MLLETQTTIRILIIALAGSATVALARQESSPHAGEAGIARAIPSAEAPPPHSSATTMEPAAGFAVFCEDRH